MTIPGNETTARDLQTPAGAVRIDRIDHLVLTVADIPRTVEFYSRVLGMRPVTFGVDRVALRFGDAKVNLHRVESEIRPCASRPTPGSADLCLVTEDLIEEVVAQLAVTATPIELGPVRRTGALGPMLSCYVRDPDRNLVEISSYRSAR